MLLRYPGGKSRGPLKNLIVDRIARNYAGGSFGDVFLGGGGLLINILKAGIPQGDVFAAEKDSSLRRLWLDVQTKPEMLINHIRTIRPSVGLFMRAKERVLNGTGHGVDALVVNRMSHGGRGVMAGPQGGLNQDKKYLIDCRWNPDTLTKTVRGLSDLLRGVIVLDDYREALDRSDFVYVDPPYWEVGNGLYLHSFDEPDHIELWERLKDRDGWVLSYNNVDEIHRLYSGFKIETTGTAGNGGDKPSSEVLIWA